MTNEMTAKEAVRELKILREEYWDDDGYGHETQQYDDTITALDMAIKALEQQTCIEDYPTCTECEHYDKEKHYCPRFCQVIKDALAEAQPTDVDAVSREEVQDLISRWLSDYLLDETREALETINYKVGDMPSVTPQASEEDIHREREQAYMLGYEDASKKFRTEPCEDCRNCKKWNKCPCGKEGHENGTSIGYSIGECKDYEPCEDCISREAVLNGLANIAKAKAKSDAQKALMGRVMFFTEQLPSVTPKYTDEEIDKAQAVEQAYVDKMVELAVKETKRPKGKWINKFGKEQGYDIAGIKTWYIQIMCDKCGFIKTAIEGHTGQYKYCPNCGAEMGGEEEVKHWDLLPYTLIANGTLLTEWLNSFDTSSATKCFEAVNLLKQRLEVEE